MQTACCCKPLLPIHLPHQNPTLPQLHAYCTTAGMGMFSEAYFIFAIGNIEPLFAVQAPDCWKCTDDAVCTCNQTTVDNVQVWQTCGMHVECPVATRSFLPSECSSIAYFPAAQNIEITAIIVGMLSFGFIADVIGRKWGSR